MKVLVGCEYSGIVREAFARLGHDAWSCDILPTEQPGNHIQGDIMEVINDGWDLAIFHPPCTYLSYAATSSWNNPGRCQLRIQALDFFRRLWEAPIERICIENPRGCASPTIAKYSQLIQPYFFGDPESKATCLWLKNLPLLTHCDGDTLFEQNTHTKPKIYAYGKTGKKKGKPIYGNNYLMQRPDRAHIRSKTFPGIAAAMADQWGNL